MKKKIVFSLAIVPLLFMGCNSSESSDNSDEVTAPTLTCKEKRDILELELHTKLDESTSDTDYTFLVQSDDGRSFTHSSGLSTSTTRYESASTSKMVTAAVILDAVQKGELSLDDTVTTYISTWTDSGNLSTIRLRDLLSFTSGLSEAPLCSFSKTYDFEECIANIPSKNVNAPLAGTEFYYGPNHLQVAGLMSMKANNIQDWNTLFNRFKSEYNVFSDSSYDLPSSTNPKLAGGMHWSAKEYVGFLDKLYHNAILDKSMTDQMFSDQLNGATLVNSPALDSLQKNWHYGFGVWIESESKISSPGLYGAYPFIDLKHKYYGILAREGKFNTFEKGYEFFTLVESDLQLWADSTCE